MKSSKRIGGKKEAASAMKPAGMEKAMTMGKMAGEMKGDHQSRTMVRRMGGRMKGKA